LETLKIKESSGFARIARLVLKSRNVAMVLGNTIHLSGVSREAFLALYLLESIKHGYYNNRFEVAARQAGTWEARKQEAVNREQLAVNSDQKAVSSKQPAVRSRQ
jgi:hypothetical protein